MPVASSTSARNTARKNLTQPQSQSNLASSKSTPNKRRQEDTPKTNAKKQRTQALDQEDRRSVSQRNHRVSPSPRQQEIDSEDENDDNGFERTLRNSTSRSTLSNEGGDDELDEFEAEAALLKGSSTTQPPASVSKPGKASAPNGPSEKALDRASSISADTRTTFDELGIRCRLVYLAKFRMAPHASIIRAVWGDGITRQSWEWEESNNRINWNGSNWKIRSIQNMQVKIRDYIKNDKSHALESISEYTPLAKFFASKYSPSAFSWVFDFTNGCIDVTESDTKPALHFYFKNIWVNFATRVKLYTDWAADPQALHNSEHSRNSLLTWVPVMAKSEKYHVDIKDFVRIESKERRPRHGSAGPVEPDRDANYLFLGTPPPE
ncbi:hypothetical protein HO173_011582 [Letharia columbiana]|uniref:Uncharacterized protein n=1 Tax=Letharia columbiana TaxID=112416 RepID=A0A8H6KYZ6_9LECA|nr:uncharacterized protein HO173_011582 [Letharia columbiana]KAF6229455.1 hypothetical protein HO173_011582 [Letharia columbiana]